jgi:hypothetical protein
VVKKLDICVQKNGGFMGVYVLCSVRYEIWWLVLKVRWLLLVLLLAVPGVWTLST